MFKVQTELRRSLNSVSSSRIILFLRTGSDRGWKIVFLINTFRSIESFQRSDFKLPVFVQHFYRISGSPAAPKTTAGSQAAMRRPTIRPTAPLGRVSALSYGVHTSTPAIFGPMYIHRSLLEEPSILRMMSTNSSQTHLTLLSYGCRSHASVAVDADVDCILR